MMNKRVKKMAGAVLLSAMIVGSMRTVPAQAKQKTNTYPLNGVNAWGYVDYAKLDSGTVNGIYATTYFAANNVESIQVQAIVCFKFNGIKYKKAKSNSSTAGGVTAKVTIDTGYVQGGIGWHYVKFGKGEWQDDSDVGDTW